VRQQCLDARRRAGPGSGQVEGEPPEVERVHAVHVLVRIHLGEGGVVVEV
jgi:hypothetical protein